MRATQPFDYVDSYCLRVLSTINPGVLPQQPQSG